MFSQCVILETFYWHVMGLTAKLPNSYDCALINKYNKYAKAMPMTSIGIALVYLLPTLNIFFLVSILHAVLQWHFLLCSSSWCKHIFSTAFRKTHYVKSVRIRSHSGPYLPAFRLNTERYGVSLRTQSECGKIRTRITANTDTFYVVRFITKRKVLIVLKSFTSWQW